MSATSWQTKHPARGILARLAPADVHLVTVTPILGDRYFAWSAGQHSSALDHARASWIDEQVGYTFASVNDRARFDYGKCCAWLAASDKTPTVSDALAERFGDPARFGSPPQWCIDGSGEAEANARWRAECEQASGAELAA